MQNNSTTRFSSRVKDYVLYRPGYPSEIVGYLEKNFGLTHNSVITDIGSGTGKSSEMFLDNGNTVYGVEPNIDMRLAAEKIFEDNSHFISINSKSEQTTLPDKSIDFIIAGQAFHWFDPIETKKEFERILKPGGKVVLIWNEREPNQTGFMGEYDAFLYKYSTDYKEIDHRNIDEIKIAAFYSPGNFKLQKFPNRQVFDFAGLKGRYDSSSYAIPASDQVYPVAIDSLQKIFSQFQSDGHVIMEYVTLVYVGQFS